MRLSAWHGPALGVLLIYLASACSSTGLPATTEHGYFTNGDVRLRYALDLPKTQGPFPVVVLGHGSGRITAARNAGYATRLLQHGIAVLRYDKRGVGKSDGEYSKAFAHLPVLADDMVAGVDFVREHARIDSARIGLMGVSQAGWVIPVAASRSPDVSFTIILSGPTVTCMQANFFDSEADDASRTLDDLSQRLAGFRGASGDFDPRPFLEAMTMPGLWVFGEEDRVIPARESANILASLVRSRLKPFTVITVPAMDHGLRHIETGKGYEYWTDVLDWFDSNVGRSTPDDQGPAGARP